MPEPTKNAVLSSVIEAHRLAKQGRQIKGNICLSDLQRLPDIVEEVQSPLALDLQFSVDEQRRKRVVGKISACLTVLCQRCLENMDFHVETTVDLVILRNELKVSGLPKNTEWILVEDETMDLVALVEDEIILALPLIASHTVGSCNPPETTEAVDIPVGDIKKSNPFDVLGSLKTKH